ncbi:MAG: hypothetical protein KME47_09725 [Nodosilinea sp. WJT8-NPBG4]|jgi:hypothetical protein|nr:hypothetical protein [Nodosilinea sp. WJT8-NPBG4]
MDTEENFYIGVPCEGQRLADGTYWTNCDANVGDISETHHYETKYDSVNGHMSKSKKTKCIETSTFNGLPFARWEDIDTDWRNAVKYSNHQWGYK